MLASLVVASLYSSLVSEAQADQHKIVQPRDGTYVPNAVPLKVKISTSGGSLDCSCGHNRELTTFLSRKVVGKNLCDGIEIVGDSCKLPADIMSKCVGRKLKLNLLSVANIKEVKVKDTITVEVVDYGVPQTFVIMSSLSIFCLVIVFVCFAISPRLQAWPGGLEIRKSANIFIAMIVLVSINSLHLQGVPAQSFCTPTVSFITQWCVIGVIGWHLSIIANAISSMTNPFRAPESNMVWYTLATIVSASVTGIAIIASGTYGYRSSEAVCWVRDTPDEHFNVPSALLVYIPVTLVIACGVVVMPYAHLKLKSKVLNVTLELRRESLRKLGLNVILFTIFWSLMGGALYSIFSAGRHENDEIIQNRNLAFFFAVVAGGLGFFDSVSWFIIHRREFELLVKEWHMSPEEIKQAMNRDKQGVGDISLPLRREFIIQTTTGITTHLRRRIEGRLKIHPLNRQPRHQFLSFSFSANELGEEKGDTTQSDYALMSDKIATEVQSRVKRNNNERGTPLGPKEVDRERALGNFPGTSDKFDLMKHKKKSTCVDETSDVQIINNLRPVSNPEESHSQNPAAGDVQETKVEVDKRDREESWVRISEDGYASYVEGRSNFFASTTQSGGIKKSEKIMFRAYEWERFAFLRNLWGIDEKDLIESLSAGIEKMVTNFSEGASGSFFFFTADKKFLVKTMSHTELQVMISILPGYCRHMDEHPASLICKFFGIYSVNLFNHIEYFSVMNNIILPPSGSRIHLKYDLKGSRIGRTAKAGSSVLKDNDFHIPLELKKDDRDRVLKQLEADSKFLSSRNIMDYSLLVGVQNFTYKTYDEDVKASQEHGHTILEKLPAARVRAPGMYFIGIIDILQGWDWNKWSERAAKILFKCHFTDYNQISCAPPSIYQERFMRFISESVIPDPNKGGGYPLFRGSIFNPSTPKTPSQNSPTSIYVQRTVNSKAIDFSLSPCVVIYMQMLGWCVYPKICEYWNLIIITLIN